MNAVNYWSIFPSSMRLFMWALLISGLISQGYAQDSLKILGRWKVIGMNNGVNYDYKKETYTISKSLRDSLCGRADSVNIVAFFLDWARSCTNCLYVFGSKNVYQEYMEEFLRSEGSFHLKPGQNEIDVSFIKDGTTKNATYRFRFENEQLILFVPSYFIKDKLELRLEKQ